MDTPVTDKKRTYGHAIFRQVERNTAPNNSGQQTYRIVFWGEVARDYDRMDVAKRFAKLFKITDRKVLGRLFSGKVLTLKQHLTTEQAHRYVTAIQELGAVCRLESESRNFFEETELKERNEDRLFEEDYDMSKLTLTPKD